MLDDQKALAGIYFLYSNICNMYVQIFLLQLHPMYALYARHDQDLPRTLEAPVALDQVGAVRAQHTQNTDRAEESWSASESHVVWSQ